ncbi:HK97 gp10 family phage protein [Lacticaseibacillus hulanensis]|uniref:HK97 gp10 family phage protein n=1 Tax=Lacticaseibacillus hulanensis TaxID=2493111 RepID=UPI000FD9912D|nr:HK97 gp10 family phage protein [Lacticaseibacillus hulanensis]
MQLDEALEQWLKETEKAVKLSVAERTVITQAGAKVFQAKLAEVTRAKHYNDDNGGQTHLAESVMSAPTDVDGNKDGTSTVYFGNKKAYIARFLNDGTIYRSGDHFVDNARREATAAALTAEHAAYSAIMKAK